MSLPVLGAALTIEDLPAHADWLRALPRDLELQSFVDADVLNGDWLPRAQEAKRLLDGHEGRLGIHGPLWCASGWIRRWMSAQHWMLRWWSSTHP